MKESDKKVVLYLLDERIKKLKAAKKQAKQEGAVLHWTAELVLNRYLKTYKNIKQS